MDKRDIIIAFLQTWLNKDYEQMFEFYQLIWREGKTVDHVKDLFINAHLKKFSIFSDTYIGPTVHSSMSIYTLRIAHSS